MKIKKNKDGLKEACLLEGDSLPLESIPEGFVKVSLEELHAKGILTADEWLKQERIIPETIRVDLNRWAFSYAKCWQETRKAKYRVIAATGIILAPEDEKIRVLGVKRVYVDGSLKHYDSTPHTKFVERGNSDQVVYSYEGSRTVGRILKVQIKGQHWWKWILWVVFIEKPMMKIGAKYHEI